MTNADEIAYWNDAAGVAWALRQGRIDAAFAPITDAALASAAPRAGDAALDIGCGAGATVLRLAEHVRRVVGIDVSQPMLAVAEARVRDASLGNVTLLRADAATHPFEPATFDLAFSRFGVMFFDDPRAAFANIRQALVSNGRLAFVCWRGLDENPWFQVPRSAVLPLVPTPPEADPEAPGPMAFADPNRVRRILTDAGYENVHVEAFDTRVTLGARENVVEFFLDIGPAARLLANADDATRAAAAKRLDEAARAHETPDGVTFDAAVWLVRATS